MAYVTHLKDNLQKLVLELPQLEKMTSTNLAELAKNGLIQNPSSAWHKKVLTSPQCAKYGQTALLLLNCPL